MTSKGRWAITSTKDIVRKSDGQVFRPTYYFRRQVAGFFNEYASADEAMTWPRKADAVGYMRRVLGARPGVDGYDVTNLAAH